MEKERRHYDREFKREAVGLSREPGRTVSGVARDLGINENMLWRWRKEFAEAEAGGFRGTPEREELRRLRRQLALGTEERDIKKKP
jgi:transposase